MKNTRSSYDTTNAFYCNRKSTNFSTTHVRICVRLFSWLNCYYDEIFIFFSNRFSQKCKIQVQTKGNYHESRPT